MKPLPSHNDQTKRLTPRNKELPIRNDWEKQAEKYGYPKTFRLPTEFLDLLKGLEEEYGVDPKELIQLTVIQFASALRAGRVKLPVKAEKAGRVMLDLPDVPTIN